MDLFKETTIGGLKARNHFVRSATEIKNTQRYLKMKGEPKSYEMAVPPLPQVIVSVRDKEGRNNALAVGYTANTRKGHLDAI